MNANNSLQAYGKRNRIDAERLRLATDLVDYHCKKARAYDWDNQTRGYIRKVEEESNSVRTHAKGLSRALKELDIDKNNIARIKLSLAFSDVKLNYREIIAGLTRLASQKIPKANSIQKDFYFMGPLLITTTGPKRLERESVMTLTLAHFFYRAFKEDTASAFQMVESASGHDIVKGGSAWAVAATFAGEAFGGGPASPTNARKFLSTHKGRVYFFGW